MKLSDHQWEFLQDLSQLIDYAKIHNLKLTGGELKRTMDQQNIYWEQGKTKTKNSKHLKSLAIDLYVFKKIFSENIASKFKWKITWEKEDAQILGDFWESLSPHNKWGGNWKKFLDTPHFERLTRINN